MLGNPWISVDYRRARSTKMAVRKKNNSRLHLHQAHIMVLAGLGLLGWHGQRKLLKQQQKFGLLLGLIVHLVKRRGVEPALNAIASESNRAAGMPRPAQMSRRRWHFQRRRHREVNKEINEQ